MTRQRETPAQGRARRGAVDDPATVLDAAARLLEVRPRSIEEVRRRLCEAGYRAELVAGAIDRLADLGILDDDAFARSWVESRDRARPRGERALRAELRRKGVAEAVIAAALGEREPAPLDAREGLEGMAPESADEAAAARLLARRGAAVAREPDPRKRRARAYALLARNGFDPDVASRAVTAWLAGEVPRPEE